MWVSADGRRQWKGFRERWMFLLRYRQAIIFPQNIGILFKKKNNPKEKLGASGQIKWRTERGRDPSLELCSVSFRTWCPHRPYGLHVSTSHWATPLTCTNSSPTSASPLRGLFPRPNSHPQINLLQGDKADYNSAVCVHAQSCLTLCDPMDSSPTDSSVRAVFLGKNIAAGCHFPLQGILPTQGLNWCFWCLRHWQVYSLPLCHLGSP